MFQNFAHSLKNHNKPSLRDFGIDNRLSFFFFSLHFSSSSATNYTTNTTNRSASTSVILSLFSLFLSPFYVFLVFLLFDKVV